jgi:hypothetical protein
MKAAQSLADLYRRLLRGRQVLSRSYYVFAYYMFDAEETRPPTAGGRTLAEAQELFQSYQEVVEA